MIDYKFNHSFDLSICRANLAPAKNAAKPPRNFEPTRALGKGAPPNESGTLPIPTKQGACALSIERLSGGYC
ncbi:hypothetical protein [Faecalispora anaeroviscerum]|uniref:hypothetical protein n=1 Tax=Faecalispora anaeroviscerum TaxID=2991836 RepID=UPI0024B962F0|nr:hypothetical protein [Faecalispora anaeroviscerum]